MFSDSPFQSIKINIDNKPPRVWPIIVGIAGVLLLIFGIATIIYCCKINKVSSTPPSRAFHRPKHIRNADDSFEEVPPPDMKGPTNVTTTNNHVVENNHVNGLYIKGGAPHMLNIYKASLNDPLLHSCSSPINSLSNSNREKSKGPDPFWSFHGPDKTA